MRPSPSSFNLQDRGVKGGELRTQLGLHLLRGDLRPGQAGGGDHQEEPGGRHAVAD